MTNESRAAFEVWARSNASPINTEVSWDAEIMEAMWSAWQASRKQALEDAAKVCDVSIDGDVHTTSVLQSYADYIRNLK